MLALRVSLQPASHSSKTVLHFSRCAFRRKQGWHAKPIWRDQPARYYALESVSAQASEPPPPGPPRHGHPSTTSQSFRADKPSATVPSSSEVKSKAGLKADTLPQNVDKSEASSKTATPENEAEKSGDEWLPDGWEDNPDWNLTSFEQLPHRMFGTNQHIIINEEFKKALQQILWQFRAPIRYAFAYGSGVFSQSTVSTEKSSYNPATSPHPNPAEAIVKWQQGGGKMIDMIYGVSYTQHWHSLNLQQHRDHYSFLGSLGSAAVSRVQDDFGAGVYFNPYITVNGTMIKYGVVNLDTLSRDLSTWDTLYLAGRLQKPCKILRDNPAIRLANQVNLISALRVALLMLPEQFTERELYMAIAGISYLGDPRMRFWTENPQKVKNIVDHQLPKFRQLYCPLIDDLPNVTFADARCKAVNWLSEDHADFKMQQDMDPIKRGNMVRRLPSAMRTKLYFLYRQKFQIPGREYKRMLEESKDEDDISFKKRQGGVFDRRIAGEDDLRDIVAKAIKQTVSWPSTTQSVKGFLTAGVSKSLHYLGEKRNKAKTAPTLTSSKDGKAKKDA